MLRFVANMVFVFCLTAWTILALLICMTVVEHGFGEVGRKLIHVFGGTNQLGIQSGSAAIWRLLGLLLITLLAAYVRRAGRSQERAVSSSNKPTKGA
jgi:hypothetical protein